LGLGGQDQRSQRFRGETLEGGVLGHQNFGHAFDFGKSLGSLEYTRSYTIRVFTN